MSEHRDLIAEAVGGDSPYDVADAIERKLANAGWRFEQERPFPQAFVLQRTEDVTGVSGTGVVAEGVEFSDGTVSLRWTSDWPTSVVFHDRGIESVEAVHGHSGKTQIVYC